MGRPPIGKTAMTAAERQRRRRAGLTKPAAVTKHRVDGPEFPRYMPSARGSQDITAKQICEWLERELLAGRIAPPALELIGRNAVSMAWRYRSKASGGNKRLQSPRELTAQQHAALEKL